MLSRADAPADAGNTGSAKANRTGVAARATGMMIALVLLSRVLGVVREMVLAHLFGQNDVTTIYNRAFAVPDMLYLLVAGGALSTVFVPVFAEYWNTDRKEDAWKTFGSVITIVAIAAAALVVFMEVTAPFFTRLVNPRFSDAAIKETVDLTRILLPAQWCFFVGGLMMGTLNARMRFLVPAMGPVIYNGGIILGGLLLHRQLGIASMTWGALFGAVAGNFLLPVWDLRRTGVVFKPELDFKHPGVVKVGKLMLPALLGLSLSQLGLWITGMFLPDDGRYTALKNAYALTQAPIGVFAQASAIVLFPTIAMLAAKQDWAAFRIEVSLGIRRILFLTVPASLLMAVLAEPIIRVLFFHPPRFGHAEVAMAASALIWYSIGTFAWSAQAVLARGFYAMQDTLTPVILTTTMVVLFVGLCAFLMPVPGLAYTGLDYRGLALAMSIVATINMLAFLVILGRRVGGLDVRGMARTTALIAVAAGISSAAAYATVRALDSVLPDTRGPAALTLLVAGGVGIAVYGGVCALMRLPELRGVREMLRKPRQ